MPSNTSSLHGKENRPKYSVQKNDREIIFGGNHFGFVFAPYFTEKATIKKTSGNYVLGSSTVMGGEAGLSYSYNINTNNSINTGLKIGTLENSYLFIAKKDDFIPPAPYAYDVGDYGELNLHYISVPLTYSHRIFLNKPNHFFEIYRSFLLLLHTLVHHAHQGFQVNQFQVW